MLLSEDFTSVSVGSEFPLALVALVALAVAVIYTVSHCLCTMVASQILSIVPDDGPFVEHPNPCERVVPILLHRLFAYDSALSRSLLEQLSCRQQIMLPRYVSSWQIHFMSRSLHVVLADGESPSKVVKQDVCSVVGT